MTVYKSDLDWKAAAELGLPVDKVSAVTRSFIDEIRNALVEHGECQLAGLGKLSVRLEVAGGGKHIRVDTTRIKIYFSKALSLKRLLGNKYSLRRSHEQAEPAGRGNEQVRGERGR